MRCDTICDRRDNEPKERCTGDHIYTGDVHQSAQRVMPTTERGRRLVGDLVPLRIPDKRPCAILEVRFAHLKLKYFPPDSHLLARDITFQKAICVVLGPSPEIMLTLTSRCGSCTISIFMSCFHVGNQQFFSLFPRSGSRIRSSPLIVWDMQYTSCRQVDSN